MNILTTNHSNGNATNYQLITAEDKPLLPIAYHQETAPEVINAMERCRKSRRRIKIYLGDPQTGKTWNEEHDVFGYIGLSKGHKAYFPILVHNARSYGGGSILDHCIVKIREAKGTHTIYQAANFQEPVIDISYDDDSDNPYRVTIDGEVYSHHKTERAAKLLKNKMQ
jgi:hypothetical protein